MSQSSEKDAILTSVERDQIAHMAQTADVCHYGDCEALFAVVEDIIAARQTAARAAYVALLSTYHEVDPDHCGGECFKSDLIDAELSNPPVSEAD